MEKLILPDQPNPIQHPASPKLAELNILVDELKTENFPATEVSLESELKGVLKSSYSDSVKIWKFTAILVNEYDDGHRQILLSVNEFNEREVRNIVDELAEVLGEDSEQKGKFTVNDLYDYRNQEDVLRKWEQFNDCNINLLSDFPSKMIILNIASKEIDL